MLGIDFETCSAVDLKRVGAWAYAGHASTRVYCMAWAFDDEEPAIWTPDQPLPERIATHLRAGGAVLAHNATFEAAVIERTLEWDTGDIDWHDTALLAAAANLPRSLEGIGKALGVRELKDTEGGRTAIDLSRVAVAADGSYVYPVPDDEQLAELFGYCCQDVRAMRACWRRLPKLDIAERELMRLDRLVNRRGVSCDVERARLLAQLAAKRGTVLHDHMERLTLGLVPKTTSVPALRDWLEAQGVVLPKLLRKLKEGPTQTTTLNAEALRAVAATTTHPAHVREVAAVRLEAGKLSSLSKLARVPELLDADHRLRGLLRAYGAHTGRWTSHGLQLHNFPRDRLGGMRAIYEQLLADGGGEHLDLLDEPLSVLSQLLRSIVVAAPGRTLLAGDFSAIEARVLAWLAGEQKVLDTFASGRDIYVEDAASIGSDNRQLGKVCRLGLGYGMAEKKLVVTARGYGVTLEPKEARRVKIAWRAANPRIVDLWASLEEAVREAIATENVTFAAGRLRVQRRGVCLGVRLPSGRLLRYWRPHTATVKKTIESVDAEGNDVTKVVEMNVIRYWTAEGKGMVPVETYGGKLVENATQAVARDVLGAALLRVEAAGFPVVLHVHDSVLAEVPADRATAAEKRRFLDTLVVPPAWAGGLPLAADGYAGQRFVK